MSYDASATSTEQHVNSCTQDCANAAHLPVCAVPDAMRHPHRSTLVVDDTELALAWISTSMDGVVPCRNTLSIDLRRTATMHFDAGQCGCPLYIVWHAANFRDAVHSGDSCNLLLSLWGLFNVPSSTSWAHLAFKAAYVASIHFKHCVHLLMTAA